MILSQVPLSKKEIKKGYKSKTYVRDTGATFRNATRIQLEQPEELHEKSIVGHIYRSTCDLWECYYTWEGKTLRGPDFDRRKKAAKWVELQFLAWRKDNPLDQEEISLERCMTGVDLGIMLRHYSRLEKQL